jgi:PAS domain S-box-containing protein
MATSTDFRDLMARAPVAAFVKDADGAYTYANPYLLAMLGKRMGLDWRGKTDADMWTPEAAALMRANDEAVIRDKVPRIFSRVLPLDDGPHTILLVEFPVPDVAGRIGIRGVGFDITEYASKDAERDRLASAIDQATESVLITDLDARITYVNPTFERVSGYTRDEVIGRNPRLLKSGVQTPWFYDAMWAALTNGLPWVADFVNRRKDGTLYTEEASISPIRDSSGAISSFVAVKRDVTQERALAERSILLARQRVLIAETIRGLRAGDTPEATAQAICRQIINLAGIKAAHISLFEPDGSALPIGFAVVGRVDPILRKPPSQRSQELHDRSLDGPWIEPWTRRRGNPYNQILGGLGSHSVVYAPVRGNRQLIGLLSVDAVGFKDASGVSELLPAVVEFADLAGALIGRDVNERAEMGRGRDRISDIIEQRAFHPVFQPILEIVRRRIVGYEALTRFDNGSNPEVVFAEADAVGLGHELETATLRAALAASAALPRPAWLNLNVSPGLVIAGEPLRSILAASPRRLVLEVTEHTAIEDYSAFREAMAALGPKVLLAVDDAGAGFASLRHILELRPAFVKLDRWLVAGLESDDARQAMIFGLRHFARATSCQLIAEGIETEDELAALKALDIPLGQGYLLGRPVPLASEAHA